LRYPHFLGSSTEGITLYNGSQVKSVLKACVNIWNQIQRDWSTNLVINGNLVIMKCIFTRTLYAGDVNPVWIWRMLHVLILHLLADTYSRKFAFLSYKFFSLITIQYIFHSKQLHAIKVIFRQQVLAWHKPSSGFFLQNFQ
jgi:hypothetical protein